MIYEYKCPNGHITELWRRVAERNDPVTCQCGEPAKHMISSPHIGTDINSDKWADMHEKEARRPDPVNLVHY